jgi:hypothetical protein
MLRERIAPFVVIIAVFVIDSLILILIIASSSSSSVNVSTAKHKRTRDRLGTGCAQRLKRHQIQQTSLTTT